MPIFSAIRYRRRLIGARERPRSVPICRGRVYAVQIVYRIKQSDYALVTVANTKEHGYRRSKSAAVSITPAFLARMYSYRATIFTCMYTFFFHVGHYRSCSSILFNNVSQLSLLIDSSRSRDRFTLVFSVTLLD